MFVEVPEGQCLTNENPIIMHDALREYLYKKKQVSLRDLSLHFQLNPEKLEKHLSPLIENGCLRKKTPDPFASVMFQSCGTARDAAVYVWNC